MASDTEGGVKEFALSAYWLQGVALKHLMQVIAEEGEARVVGGAVRNAIMGQPPGDIDIATDLTPDRVAVLGRRAGISVHETGLDHGTLTMVSDGHPFEVTTLREDVSTDGRRATVRFTQDWGLDASRRDFTINALFLDGTGHGYDFVGGYADCLAHKVRFIGDPSDRILEDHLRMLRFFRMHAFYGEGPLDTAALDAVRAHRDKLSTLPAERIAHELARLLKATGAADIVAIMVEDQLFEPMLGEPVSADAYRALCAAERTSGRPVSSTLAFLALARFDADIFDRISATLKLSRKSRSRGLAAVAAAAQMPPRSVPHVRSLLYELGAEAFTDGLIIAIAQGVDVIDMSTLLQEARRWSRPRFPVSGHDLLHQGGGTGPALGERLRRLESLWRDSDFSLPRDALLALDQDFINKSG